MKDNTMILDPQWRPTQACVCGGAEYKLGPPSTADVSANKHYGHRDGDRKRGLAEYGQNKADLNRKGPATENAVCRSGLRSLSAAECYILSRLF